MTPTHLHIFIFVNTVVFAFVNQWRHPFTYIYFCEHSGGHWTHSFKAFIHQNTHTSLWFLLEKNSCQSDKCRKTITDFESQIHTFVDHTERQTGHNLLNYGLSVRNVSEHHALDDAVVFLLWQVLVRNQGSAILCGWGWVDPLQPGMALDLFQGSPSLGIPLKHTVYQTEGRMRRRMRDRKNKIKINLNLKDTEIL